jgi:hypothetical protein
LSRRGGKNFEWDVASLRRRIATSKVRETFVLVSNCI